VSNTTKIALSQILLLFVTCIVGFKSTAHAQQSTFSFPGTHLPQTISNRISAPVPVRSSQLPPVESRVPFQQPTHWSTMPTTVRSAGADQFFSQAAVFPQTVQQPQTYATPEPIPMVDSVYENSPSNILADPGCFGCNWHWQLLPNSLLYKSYMAGPKESRLASGWLYDTDQGWIWDLTAGGRVGIVRYGSSNEFPAEGWQLDIEGAAFPRLNMEESLDLDSTDFRFGLPMTWTRGPYQAKFAYYHMSSHVGDEYLARNPGFVRRNYSKDAFVLGFGYFATEDLRIYGEAGYAFVIDGGADHWEFQFGAEYIPMSYEGIRGAPFFAINGLIREEVDFGGGVTIMAGWRWRGSQNDRTFRFGVQYYNGKTTQFAFLNESEELIGLGAWYDF